MRAFELHRVVNGYPLSKPKHSIKRRIENVLVHPHHRLLSGKQLEKQLVSHLDFSFVKRHA